MRRAARTGDAETMPFTVSHAAAVLPFVRTPLPAAALVIGSMTPDLPFFVPVHVPRALTHSVTGAVTFDVLIGLLAIALWWGLLRAPAIDMMPRAVRERIGPIAWRPTPRGIAWLVVALLIGIATHLAWDSFTHAHYVSDLLPVLQTPIDLAIITVPLYTVLHAVSSLVGGAILIIWVLLWLRRSESRADARTLMPSRVRIGLWTLLATLFAGVLLGFWVPAALAGSYLLDGEFVFSSAVVSIGITAWVAVVIAGVWTLAERGTRRPSGV
jgi:hypothetical protein